MIYANCTHCIESLPLLLINVVACGCVCYNTGWWDLDDLDPRISSPMAWWHTLPPRSVKETQMQKNGVRYSASDVRPMFVGPVECGESVSAGVPGLGQLIPRRGTTTTNPPNTCSDSIFRKLMNGRDHSNWAQAVKCHSDARLARGLAMRRLFKR